MRARATAARRPRDGAFLTSEAARRLDEDLIAGRGCDARSLEVLMRAAGRCAATATLDAFAGTDFVVLCGPGNNGGDGLALARECATRREGSRVSVWYPRGAGTNELYAELARECRETENVEFVDEDAVLGMMRETTSATAKPRCFVDALFGFSFKGAVRAPFVDVVNALVELTNGDARGVVHGELGHSERLGRRRGRARRRRRLRARLAHLAHGAEAVLRDVGRSRARRTATSREAHGANARRRGDVSHG